MILSLYIEVILMRYVFTWFHMDLLAIDTILIKSYPITRKIPGGCLMKRRNFNFNEGFSSYAFANIFVWY